MFSLGAAGTGQMAWGHFGTVRYLSRDRKNPLIFFFFSRRRTEGSSKEEQIIQKEQILAELQRVEKELHEKAHAQLLMSGGAAVELSAAAGLQQPPPPAAVRSSTKREAGEGQRGVGEGQEEIQPPPPAPFNFVLDQQGAATLATTEVGTGFCARNRTVPYHIFSMIWMCNKNYLNNIKYLSYHFATMFNMMITVYIVYRNVTYSRESLI